MAFVRIPCITDNGAAVDVLVNPALVAACSPPEPGSLTAKQGAKTTLALAATNDNGHGIYLACSEEPEAVLARLNGHDPVRLACYLEPRMTFGKPSMVLIPATAGESSLIDLMLGDQVPVTLAGKIDLSDDYGTHYISLWNPEMNPRDPPVPAPEPAPEPGPGP